MAQTTITGPVNDVNNGPFANKWIKFTLGQLGTDGTAGVTVAQSSDSVKTDASGDFTVDIWDNGESGKKSILEIKIEGSRPEYVIIPQGTASIELWDLIENHQVTESDPQLPVISDLFLKVASNLSDLSDAATAQVNLGIVTVSGGGQVGDGASATTGFAGGNNAIASGAGRVQLGEGTNSTDSTIQFLSSGSVTAEEFGLLSGAETAASGGITYNDSAVPTSAAVIDLLNSSSKFGFADYNDTSGSVALVADTWTDVPNNTLGAFTNIAHLPTGVTSMIDSNTGYLDFSDLTIGSELLIRNDFSVNPDTNNALLEARYLLGTGAGEYELKFFSERLDGGSNQDYQRVTPFPLYIGDSNTGGNPGKLQVKLSTTGTITNAGSYISIRLN